MYQVILEGVYTENSDGESLKKRQIFCECRKVVVCYDNHLKIILSDTPRGETPTDVFVRDRMTAFDLQHRRSTYPTPVYCSMVRILSGGNILKEVSA